MLKIQTVSIEVTCCFQLVSYKEIAQALVALYNINYFFVKYFKLEKSFLPIQTEVNGR